MTFNIKISSIARSVQAILFACVCFSSCCPDNVPYDVKHMKTFHELTTPQNTVDFRVDNLALFVDYSNCISDGMQSTFYQQMVSPLVAATKEFWAIKGNDITKENGSVYALLNNVQEVNYAALDKAIAQMAERDTESSYRWRIIYPNGNEEQPQ